MEREGIARRDLAQHAIALLWFAGRSRKELLCSGMQPCCCCVARVDGCEKEWRGKEWDEAVRGVHSECEVNLHGLLVVTQ
jgi:hypothetical protein